LLALGKSLNADFIVAFLHEAVIGTIIDHLEGRSEFEPWRREPMPNGAMITIDTNTSALHYPGF
jgi:hypothetical protein